MLLLFRAVRIWESFTQKPLPEKVSPVKVVDWVERGAGEVSTSKFSLSRNSFIRKKREGVVGVSSGR